MHPHAIRVYLGIDEIIDAANKRIKDLEAALRNSNKKLTDHHTLIDDLIGQTNETKGKPRNYPRCPWCSEIVGHDYNHPPQICYLKCAPEKIPEWFNPTNQLLRDAVNRRRAQARR